MSSKLSVGSKQIIPCLKVTIIAKVLDGETFTLLDDLI